ncbi:hypothetical protein CKO41_04525 [Thiococcus pfennigii]|nr:hypothetical protein [Thiococcus pfennigii]MBK1731074.1 hypothetical protein [Thiococcus pfennigii]
MYAIFGVIWAVTGLGLLLGFAVFRLVPFALDALGGPLIWPHWLALTGFVAFMAYAEGYHGFQRSFSPRFGARCRYLYEHPTWSRVLLAPLFCMGYFDATRRRRIASFTLTLMIIALIVGVQHVAQPWRGIIDAGVCVGLIWGIAATVVYSVLAFTSKDFSHPPEVA